jgi:hypothetical protein
MPKVMTSRVKYPEGWELIEPTLRELQGKMREGWNIICFVHSLLYFFFRSEIFENYYIFMSLYSLSGS